MPTCSPGKTGARVIGNVINMANWRIDNIYPNLAVRSGRGRVRRQALADFFPANALGFIDGKDKRRLYDRVEKKLREGEVKNGILVETLVDRESPVLRRDRWAEVISPVVVSLDVGSDEFRSRAQNWVHSLEIFPILRIEKLPPQTLDHPRSHCKLISPRRHRISYDLAGRRVRRYGKYGASGAGNAPPRISLLLEAGSRRVPRRVSVARHGCWKRHPNTPVRSCSPHDSRRATRSRYRPPTSVQTSQAPLYSGASNRPGNIDSRTRCVPIHDR